MFSDFGEEDNILSSLLDKEVDFQMPQFDMELFENDSCKLLNSDSNLKNYQDDIYFEENEDAPPCFGPNSKIFNFAEVEATCKIEEDKEWNAPRSAPVDTSKKLVKVDEQDDTQNVLTITTKPLTPPVKVKIQVKNSGNITLTAEQKKKKGLALRADVMNKNLFRAIRRECKCIYEDYLKSNSLSNSRSKRIFKSNLRKFSQHLLDSTNVEWRVKSNFDTAEFPKFLGLFINTCLMKKVLDESTGQDMITNFNNLLYSYSHKKFYDYLSVSEVSTVIKIIFEHAEVSGFVSNHPTLSTNQEEYEDHIAKILKQI